jgi:hypothetical protein
MQALLLVVDDTSHLLCPALVSTTPIQLVLTIKNRACTLSPSHAGAPSCHTRARTPSLLLQSGLRRAIDRIAVVPYNNY